MCVARCGATGDDGQVGKRRRWMGGVGGRVTRNAIIRIKSR